MSERTYKLPSGREIICEKGRLFLYNPVTGAIVVKTQQSILKELFGFVDSLQQQVNGLNEESLANFQTAAERGKQIAEKDWTIKQLESVRDQLKTWLGECGTERDALREQLAERDRTIAQLTKRLEEARRNLNIQQAKIKMLEVDNEMLESMVGQG
ncbi:hypothetical protein MHB46_21470 [Paenibacillus sp. FSL H7-0703]|uniref:hypothetical protein n=1 Tax=Paenibacillus sp. FSL H7-0703 TaxID=2921438 RepID=UPI0030F7A84B